METRTPSKPIVITMEDGKEYTLEYNRDAVVAAEEDGFITDDIDVKMMLRIPQLFYFAFYKNHPEVTREKSDDILFNQLGGLSQEMTQRLAELYADAYTSLMNNEGKPKNPKVRVRM